MSKTKKWTSLIFAIILGVLTCGVGLALPSFSKQSSKLETVTAVDQNAAIENSGLEKDSNGFYQIASKEELTAVAYAISQGKSGWASADYVLTADINLVDAFWTPIGTENNPFTGRFNGNGHTIHGAISAVASSYDGVNVGLFGSVKGTTDDPAAIYDLVLGDFNFTPPYSELTTAGRLAGKVENTVLADIYDWSYLKMPTELNFQTIGTINSGVTIYGGNTFLLGSLEADGEWTYELKTPQNYDAYVASDHNFQFGYGSAAGSPTIAGRSVYIVDDETGIFYKNGDSTKADLGSLRILKNSDGTVIDAATVGIVSDKYTTDLPTIIGNTATTSGLTLEPASTGKKPLHYAESATATSGFTSIAGYSGNGPLYVVWKDLSYNITVNLGYTTTPMTINGVGFNTPWSEIVSQISRPNNDNIAFILVGLTDPNDSNKPYYTAKVEWDKNYTDYTVEPSYPNGDTAVAWDSTGANSINVTLNATWQQSLANITVNFDKSKDTSLNFENAFAGDLSAAYTTGSAPEDFPLGMHPTNEDSSFDFSAAGGATVNITIPVTPGYVLGTVTKTGTSGEASISNSGDTYTLTISDAYTSDVVINVPVYRTTYDISVISDEHVSDITISGNSAGTTYKETNGKISKITTRVDETFTLAVTYANGYAYSSVDSYDTSKLSAATTDGTTINVSVKAPLSGSPSITIQTRALSFDAYLHNINDQPYNPEQSVGTVIFDGTEWTGDTSWENHEAPGEDGLSFVTTDNAYYKVDGDYDTNGLKVTTDAAGNTPAVGVNVNLVSNDNEKGVRTYTITGIAAGGEYHFHVQWIKQTYSSTVTTGSTSDVGSKNLELTNSDENIPDFVLTIPDADGNPVANDSVITVTNPASYSPFDTLTFSYNIESQYYEFAGWYYLKNNELVLIENGDTVFGSTATDSGTTLTFASAPAQAVTIYAAVTGKTATVSLPNDATYYYEHNGKIEKASKALSTLSTSPTSSIIFKYGDPDYGSLSTTMNGGYNLSRVVFTTADRPNASEAVLYELGTSTTISGYQNLVSNTAALAALFGGSSTKNIFVIAAPKTATLNFYADEGTESASATADYYFGIPVDITHAVNAISKDGYTADGWIINISDNNHTLKDPSDATSSLYYISDGKYMLNLSAGLIEDIATDQTTFKLTRTYTANKYTLTLDADGGKFSSGTTTTYTVTYGEKFYSQFSGITPTRTGYNFIGWQIGSETITAATVWDWEADQTAVAQWEAISYTVIINKNDGTGVIGTNYSIAYGADFGTIVSAVEGLTRTGFEFDSLNYVYNNAGYPVNADTIFEEGNNFPDFDFGTNLSEDNIPKLTLYVKWVFNSDMFDAEIYSGDQTKVYNGSKQEFELITGITNGAGGVLESVPTEGKISVNVDVYYNGDLKGKYGLVEIGNTSDSVTGYKITLTNVAESGSYSAIVTFTDGISTSALRDTYEIDFTAADKSTNISITPAQLLSFNPNIIDPNGAFGTIPYGLLKNAARILDEYPNAEAILRQSIRDAAGGNYFDGFNSVEGTGFADVLSKSAGDKFAAFINWLYTGNTKTPYDASTSDGEEIINRLGFVTKITLIPMMYDVNMRAIYTEHPLNADGLISDTITNLDTNWTKADFLTDEEIVAIVATISASLESMYTDFGANGTIWRDKVSFAFSGLAEFVEVDDTTNTNTNSNTNVIAIKEKGSGSYIAGDIVKDNNAGFKVLAYEIKLTELAKLEEDDKVNYIENFKKNFQNIVESSGKFYVVITPDSFEGTDWAGISTPTLYAPTTVLELPATEVPQTISEWTGNTKEFNLTTATRGKYTKVVATVQTSAATSGTYSFIEKDGTVGRLIITSFKLYVDENRYYTFTRQDGGNYTITGYSGEGLATTDPILANISLAIEQDLEIIATEKLVPISFQTVELHVNPSDSADLDGSFVADSTATVTIKSVTVQETGGESFQITIGSDEANYDIYNDGYYDTDGALIFSISGQTIQFNTNSGYSLVSIDVTSSYTNGTSNNYKFAGYYTWTGGSAGEVDVGNDIDTVETAVKGLSAWADTTQTLTDTYFMTEGALAETYISAVYTNASWVTFDAKTDDTDADAVFDDGFASSSFFAEIGTDVSFDNYDNNIDYNVYTFDGFGKSESSKEVTVADAPKQTFTAVIGLATPTGVSISNQNFAAQLEGDLDLSTLAGHVNITNNGSSAGSNNHGIIYTYTWYNSDPSAEGASAIKSIQANTSSNGTYYVVVTATKTGFNNSETAQASFAITFVKTTLSLTAPTGNLTETYKNEDFRNEITIGVALANDQASDLPTYPAGISLSAILSDSTLGSILDVTIQKQTMDDDWEDVADGIINAGTYQITVSLKTDVNVVNAYEYASETGSITFIFTVAKKVVEINAGPGEGTVTTSDGTGVVDGVLFSKSLDYTSDANRVYPVNVAVDGITGVSHISLNLKRADDKQTAGNYKLVINEDATYTALSANYDISIDDNNTWFRILPSSGGLQAIATVVKKADPENGIVDNTRIYNGAAHSSTVMIEKAENEFQLITYLVYNGDGDSNNVEWARYSLVLQTASDEDGTPENIDITNLDTSFFDGWTFTLVSGANVGSYVISCSGENASYRSFEFIGGTTPTLEIVKKELTISGISMEYNGTSSFTLNTETSNNEGNTQKFVVVGLISDEDLDVTITFSNSDLGTYTYGAAENWLNASLSNGTSGLAENYSLNLTGVSGQITKSSKALTLTQGVNTLTYGDSNLSETALSNPQSLATTLGLKVSGYTEGEDYNIEIVSIETAAYSTTKYLKAGTYTVKVILTSDRYQVTDETTGDDLCTHSFTLTVEKKQITASPTTFEKDYDGEANVEQAITLSGVVEGDVVSASGEYDNANVGKGKVVTITIDGADSANYTLTNHEATGEINPATIILNASIQNNTDDGKFVDQKEANGTTRFTIQYQNGMDAADTLDQLTQPNKTGYTFNGWAVGTVGGKGEAVSGFAHGTILKEGNILSFLDAIRENIDDCTLSIYATWTINTYKIKVTDSTTMGGFVKSLGFESGSGSQTGAELPEDGDSAETGTWTYTFTYYTKNITLTRQANSGYVLEVVAEQKIGSLNGEDYFLTQNEEVEIANSDFRAAVITLTISIDPNDYYTNGNSISFENSDLWSTGAGTSVQRTLLSTDLADTNIQTFFARAALAGYTFAGWSYQGSSGIVTIDYDADGEYLLSEIVNELYPSYTDDITIYITAVLKANTYSLTLNPDGGAFADGVETNFGGTLEAPSDLASNFTFTNEATYGEAISDAIAKLPIPTKTGFTFAGWQIKWTDADETENSVTISTISEDSATTNDTIWQWASDMTATAIWSHGDFDLTVTLDTGALANAGASVTISYQVADGTGTRTEYVVDTDDNENDKIHTYTLNHGIVYTITVTTNEGYVITWPTSVSGFILDGTGDERTISGIYEDSELVITIGADSHTVTIVPPTNGNFEVSITGATAPQVSGPFDAEDEEGNLYIYYTFNAATEQTIVVTIEPNAGYSVTETPTEKGFDISNESNVFTITNFTDDITIDFSSVVTANSYNMTVTYDGTISVAGLTGGTSSTDEGLTTYTVSVSTGTSYTFYIQEVYGYNYSNISVSGTANVAVSENAETEGDYAGYRKVTVSGYTAAFDLTIVTTKDVFTVNADWVAVDSGFNIMDSGFNIQGSVTGISVAPTTQDIEYLSQATITASNTNKAYGFIGWYYASVVGEDGTVNTDGAECLSKESTYKPTVKGDINVIALFQYQTYKVNISIEYTDRVDGTNHHAYFTIGEDTEKTHTSYSGTMSHNDLLRVTAVPLDGYKFVGWYVGAVDDSIEGQNATYEATITGELTLVMKIDASDLEVTFTPTVRINGVPFSGENIADLDYGTIELGTYEASKFEPIAWHENNFVAQSYTGGTLYLRVAANEGYEFNGLYNLSGDPTFSKISTTENGIIYAISGLIYNVEIDYNVEVRFTAISTPINIVFSDGENRLEAGRITVTNANGLNIVQNNTHNVTVHAITGSQVRVTAYISLGQGFIDPENALNNLRTTSSGTIANPKITIPEASTGWSAQISFEITDFTGTPVIEVLVKPKTYTVNLVGWDSSDLGSFTVTYGAPIVLPEGLTISTRDGFALLGFYKYANGVGTRFIDGDLNPIGNWTDNGYRRNSDGAYVVTDNFVDPEKGIFEIYASYSINKARLQIDVVPPGLENVPPTVAANIVVLGTTTANSWSSSEDPSFVEVREGATISVQAPVYENYRFAYWTIVRTNRAGASTREIVTSELIENFEHDGYSLVTMTLTYYANVGVVANGNGSASLTYWDEINKQRVEVTGSEYIPTTSPITLNATPDEGYNFIGWFTQDGQLLTMNSNHEVSASLEKPLSPTTYEARFESQTFRMNITVRNPEAISIQTVSVAGQQVADFANGFDVKLGQMVTLTVAVAQNTNIAWNGVGALIPMLNNRYIYTVSYSDLVDGEINLEAYVSYEECDVNISVNLTNGIETEKSLAANIYYFEDSQPIQISAINGVTLRRVIGSTLELRIDLRANYKLDSILIDGVDSGATLDGNIARIVLTPQDAYTDAIDIQVNIARDMWLDSVSSEEHTLSGEGTDSNPYMVRTADDLAFVAYMINVENSAEYANAVYVLDADIDLSGRYWSPIGTESNPFNGKFYYRNYSISNVSVVYNYSGQLTHGGVFGYITENAEFEMPQGDWLIAVIVVSVVLVLIIIALIIFFVLRKKRKKKLEQLANS